MRIVLTSNSQTPSITALTRSIYRAVHKLPKHTITLTTTQVQQAIQHSKNNNSVGPDNLSIRHLKHIGPLGLTFLTSMYTTALNKNIIPHMWKLADIISIPKPNKDTNMGTSYRPISLLSVVTKAKNSGEVPSSIISYPPRSTVLFAILNRLSTGRITQYCL